MSEAVASPYRRPSLWWDQLSDELAGPRRPPLAGPTSADVAIVGAGFTGLWTAYYLLRADPTLRVVVLEAETAGFGASGRNGGWCSALFPTSLQKVAASSSREAAIALFRAMQSTVDEIGAVVAAERIDAGFRKGGTVVLARTPLAAARGSRGRRVAFLGSRAAGPAAARRGRGSRAPRRDGHARWGRTHRPAQRSTRPASYAASREASSASADDRRGHPCHPAGARGLVSSPRRVTCGARFVVRVNWRVRPRPWTGAAGGHPASLDETANEPLPQQFWDQVGLREAETFVRGAT